MKKLIASLMVLISLSAFSGMKSPSDPASWSDKKIEKWFAQKEWIAGWKVSPDPSINKRALAVAWFKNKERWDKAFNWLKSTELTKLEAKRYDIDGDNLFASVSDYMTKDPETTNFEAHRNYIDVQYIISGSELMNAVPLSSANEIISPYDEAKDLEFMSVKNFVNHKATPSNFFIFFPSDAHRSQLKDGASSQVKKVVIKLRVE